MPHRSRAAVILVGAVAPAKVQRSLMLRHCFPDFGTACRAFIDEVDPRQIPVGLNLPDLHGKAQAAWTHGHGRMKDLLLSVMLCIGWHDCSPLFWELILIAGESSSIVADDEPSYRAGSKHLINSCERTKNIRTNSACVTKSTQLLPWFGHIVIAPSRHRSCAARPRCARHRQSR